MNLNVEQLTDLAARLKDGCVAPALYSVMSLLAVYITLSYIDTGGMLMEGRSSFVTMFLGTMERPYVYRTLLPLLAKIFTYLTPTFIKHGVVSFFLHNTVMPLGYGYANLALRAPQCLYPVAVIAVLMFASLLVYGFTMARIYRLFFPQNQAMAPVISILALLILIPFDWFAKLYDFSTMALVALCLLYMYEEKWRHYLVVFALACINKETAIFEIGLFTLVYLHRLHERPYGRLLLAQIGMYGVIIATIRHLFAGNPGIDNYYHPQSIISMFLQDIHTPMHITALILLCHFIARRWHELPLILRQSLWLAPVNVLLYYFCCWIGEYRDFFEIFPYLTLAGGHGILHLSSPEKTL